MTQGYVFTWLPFLNQSKTAYFIFNMQFQTGSRTEARKTHNSESSTLEFSEKISANSFALPDAEENTTGPLNGGGIASPQLLRTILANCLKFHNPSF